MITSKWFVACIIVLALFIILVITFIKMLHRRRTEYFIGGDVIPPVAANQPLEDRNEGERPWEHHVLHETVPVELDVKQSSTTGHYRKAYNYEMTNLDYENALKRVFSRPCNLDKKYGKPQFWTVIPFNSSGGIRLSKVYNNVVAHIAKRINGSKLFNLEGEENGKRTNIQVVHDRLIRVYKHNTVRGAYRMDIELLLYREAKFQGKHVLMCCLLRWNALSQQWSFNVLSTSVEGIVFDDKIGMFPVVANDPLNSDANMQFKPNPFKAQDMILMDDASTIRKVKEQSDNLRLRMDTAMVMLGEKQLYKGTSNAGLFDKSFTEWGISHSRTK